MNPTVYTYDYETGLFRPKNMTKPTLYIYDSNNKLFNPNDDLPKIHEMYRFEKYVGNLVMMGHGFIGVYGKLIIQWVGEIESICTYNSLDDLLKIN
jgi:hypothetical protein